MAATLRELRQRRASVAETKKITKAMELIAASRVSKAQQKAIGSEPFTRELLRAVTAVANFSGADHPLAREHHEQRNRSAVLVISSDRGLAGAYPGNVMRAAESLIEKLQAGQNEVLIYTCGKKARDYFAFRGIPVEDSWEGFSEEPRYEHAQEVGQALIDRFLAPPAEGGVDELHVVFTHFKSLVSQQTRIVRLLPVQFVSADEVGDDDDVADELDFVPEYDFEPSAEAVLDELLPMYIIDSLKFFLRSSAASELASRQQAMHSATDNADKLIQDLTRLANQARQAEITQEINEIVGGAGALAEQGA